MIYLASDHGGYQLKNKLATYLIQQGWDISDEGPYEQKSGDDYPDYIIPAMEKVQKHEQHKAIVICRNGVGVSILANKFKGIRAALSWNPEHAASSRFDDNSNVLALPAEYISEEEAYKVADAWLNTAFSGEERHIRRLEKISRLENK